MIDVKKCTKIKLLIVSHSYVVDENQKNIDSFSDQITPLVLVPHRVNDSIHGGTKAQDHSKIIILRRISLWGAQYLLGSLDLNLRKFNPDIIHVEYDPWSLIFWQVCLMKSLFARKAKLICTVKNNTYRNYPGVFGWLKKNIANFFVKRCDFFIAVNKGVQEIYCKNFKVAISKIRIMQHLGVDTELFSPVQLSKAKSNTLEPTLNIGFCGRFDEEKGIEDLINALTPFANKIPELKLFLLGSGSMQASLYNKGLPWLKILERVPHAEVAKFMHTLDMFVLPSKISDAHEEHDAHVLLEAMACGVAVIGSSSGIIPEVIDNGAAGLLYEAGNVADLASKLDLFINSVELRKKYATIGLNRTNTLYSVKAVAQQKQNIYKQLLQLSI